MFRAAMMPPSELQLSCSSSQRNLHDGPRLTYSEFLVISYCAVPRIWHPKDWS